MGNNSSMIDIKFDRPHPTIYYAGETIAGQVEFTVQKFTEIFDDIYLTITGSIGFTTVRTTRMQNGQTEQIVDHHDIRIFADSTVLCPALAAQQKINGSVKVRTNFAPGQYVYPFSFHLPENLPPTLHPLDFPFVRYELQLFIEKKWFSPNTDYRYPLRIFPRINLLQMENSQASITFDTKRKNIKIKGRLQHAGLIPGEETTLSLSIYNPNHTSIKRIDVCLIQHYEIEECRHRSEVGRLSIPDLVNTSEEHIRTICPVAIPIGIPPTHNFETSNRHTSVTVSVYYDLRLEVKVRGLFSDFDLQVPIMIGTESGKSSTSKDGSMTKTSTKSMNSNVASTFQLQIRDNDSVLPANKATNSHHAASK